MGHSRVTQKAADGRSESLWVRIGNALRNSDTLASVYIVIQSIRKRWNQSKVRHEYNVTSSSKKGMPKSPLILSGQALAGLANVRSRSQREQNETATVAKGTNWNRRQWIGSGFGKTMSYNV